MNQKRALTILYIVVATELIGFGLIIPVLPQLAKQFETNWLLLGVLMAAYSFAQFIAAPLLGSLSDRFGRKPILIFSKCGTVLAYVILAIAQSYGLFLVSRLLDGFTGGNISVARAYVADVTTEKERPKGMAVIGLAFGTGFIIGPALGGLLYTPAHGHMLAAWVAGGMSLIAALLTLFLLEEPKKHIESHSAAAGLFSGFKALKRFPIRIICGTYLIYMCVFSGFETSFVLFTEQLFQLTVKQNSWLFMYAGLLSFVVQGTIVRRAFTNLKLVTIGGFTSLGLSFIGFALAPSLAILLIFMSLMAIGIALVNAYLPSLLSVYINPSQRGAVMGVYEGTGSLSRILGPILAYTVVIQVPRVGYMGYGLTLVCLGVGLWCLLKTENAR